MLPDSTANQPFRPISRTARRVAVLAIAYLAVLSTSTSQAQDQGARAQHSSTTDRYGDTLPAGALTRFGTTRLRHGADVTFVSFGPDGRTLITAGLDNTIRLWDLAKGTEIRRFRRPNIKLAQGIGDLPPEDAIGRMVQGRDEGFSVAVTPDGKTLAAGSGNVIQLSNIETGKELRTIPAPASGLAGLLFSPDGRTLAGRATNGVVFVWATNTGNEMHQLKPVPREASNEFVLILGGGRADAPGMAFTPDSKTLAAAVTDYEKQKAIHSIKFWDIASGKEIRKIRAPEGVSVSAVAVSASGKILAYGAGNDLHVCEAETGKEIKRLTEPDGGMLALVISQNDKTVAVRGRNQRIRIWISKLEKNFIGSVMPNQPSV